MWHKAYTLIRNHIVETGDQAGIVFNLQRQRFTAATSELHAFFTSVEFSTYVCAIFAVGEDLPTVPQRSIAVQLSIEIYYIFLRYLTSLMNQDRNCSEVPLQVQEMSAVGRSKVRHVGGWALRKILTKYRKYVLTNMFSTNASTLANVRKKQTLCDLLDNVIIPFAKLTEDTMFPETIEVTQEQQYREMGLLHISDQAYLFFVALEQKRVELLNVYRLKKTRGDMVFHAMENMKKDEMLTEKWNRCFGITYVTKYSVSFILQYIDATCLFEQLS